MQSFTVTVDDHAPVLTVDTTATAAETALKGMHIVLDRLRAQLVQLQSAIQAAADQLVQGSVLSVSQAATEQTSGRTKVLGLMAAAGLLVASGLAFVVEGLAYGATRRRHARAPSAGSVRPTIPPPSAAADVRPQGEVIARSLRES